MMKKTILAMMASAGLGSAADLSEEEKQRSVEVLREGVNAHAEAFWPAMHAAEALTLAGRGQEVRPVLEPLIGTEADGQKRCGLAREMARAGDQEKVGMLVAILRGADDYAHVHAAESLFKLGWREEESLLRELVNRSGNVRLSIMAAAALGKGGDAEGLAFLRKTLAAEKDPNVFFLAAWALGQIGEKADVRRISLRMGDAPDAWIASFLHHALARLGNEEGQLALVRNLGSDDARLRAYAAEAAGQIPLPATKERLVELLGDEDLDVRVRAAQSLLLMNLP